MSAVVAGAPLHDEYAILPVSANLRKAATELVKPKVKVLLIEDTTESRIVGFLREVDLLDILASGVDPSRTKVAKHMHPRRGEEHVLARITPDAPASQLSSLIAQYSPAVIIVEHPEDHHLIGYLSPKDVDTLREEETHVGATKRSRGLAEPLVDWRGSLLSAPTMHRWVKGRGGGSASVALDKPLAEQLLNICTSLNAEGAKLWHCVISAAQGFKVAWPVGAAEIHDLALGSIPVAIVDSKHSDLLVNITGPSNKGGNSSLSLIGYVERGRMRKVHDIKEKPLKSPFGPKSMPSVTNDVASLIAAGADGVMLMLRYG